MHKPDVDCTFTMTFLSIDLMGFSAMQVNSTYSKTEAIISSFLSNAVSPMGTPSFSQYTLGGGTPSAAQTTLSSPPSLRITSSGGSSTKLGAFFSEDKMNYIALELSILDKNPVIQLVFYFSLGNLICLRVIGFLFIISVDFQFGLIFFSPGG